MQERILEGREEITIEPGMKGLFVIAKSRTIMYSDWILLVSHVTNEPRQHTDYTHLVDMLYCYASIDLSFGVGDEVNKKPFALGIAEHYRFYKPTEEEIEIITKMFKAKNLKYIKGINKVIDR